MHLKALSLVTGEQNYWLNSKQLLLSFHIHLQTYFLGNQFIDMLTTLVNYSIFFPTEILSKSFHKVKHNSHSLEKTEIFINAASGSLEGKDTCFAAMMFFMLYGSLLGTSPHLQMRMHA